jgi:CRISPR/Cas system CSM-associated protein Csm2 small subunit
MIRANGKESWVFLPDDVMLDHRLTLAERIVFATVLNLNRKGSKGCFANNRYFANRIGVTTRQIRRVFQKLEDFGLVERLEGNHRWITSARHNLKPNYVKATEKMELE